LVEKSGLGVPVSLSQAERSGRALSPAQQANENTKQKVRRKRSASSDESRSNKRNSRSSRSEDEESYSGEDSRSEYEESYSGEDSRSEDDESYSGEDSRPEKIFCIKKNCGLAGHTISVESATTIENCKKACQEEKKCYGFTYTEKKGRCALKRVTSWLITKEPFLQDKQVGIPC